MVRRVASSTTFEKSPRLQAFFLHVCRCALDNQPEAATEQQIGIHVFGRPRGYNANEDNIVRSQARLPTAVPGESRWTMRSSVSPMISPRYVPLAVIAVRVFAASPIASAVAARTRSWLAADALSSYVESQEWQVEQTRQGIRDADEGRVVGHDRVAEWLRSWGTKSEKRPPKCR